jgi:hypothetical protein
MLMSNSDDFQPVGEPERETSLSELWEELAPDNQRLAVRLLAQLIEACANRSSLKSAV